MVLQNLHTHSTYCDGKNTIAEMVETAVEKGFSSIGFSSHSYMSFDVNLGLNPADEESYLEDIRRENRKYNGKIDVYAGLEFELYSDSPIRDDFDYVIGSCHYIEVDGELVIFDRGVDAVKGIIDKYFGGKGIDFAKHYYLNTVTRLKDVYDFDIIGHFDIITKHIETERFFDTDSKEYRSYALEALHTLSEKFRVFEVNTGAVARAGRTAPYPQDFIIKEMKNLGIGVTVTSDCHRREYMDVFYPETFELLKECGYKEIMVFNGKEFEPYPIN